MSPQNGFKKAAKAQARLRMALFGASGCGKSLSALFIAQGLGDRIGVIDTEHSSAAIYADRVAFDVLDLDQYHPKNYIDAIHAAAAGGYDVLIIDSLSHAWNGTGGVLAIVDRASQGDKNSFSAWRQATPLHNQLVDAILAAPMHVIVTMRSKTEYVLERNEKGKMEARKVGMAPVQRDGMEYEFTVVGQMNAEHELMISKTRFSDLDNAVIANPDQKLGEQLKAWLADGAPSEENANIGSLDMKRLLRQAYDAGYVTGQSHFDTVIRLLKREGVLVDTSPAEDVIEAIHQHVAKDAAQEQVS